MSDAEIVDYLQENGYPAHLVREGRAGLVRRWREFVEQVERGYRLGLEDYRNDLDVRGILELAGAVDGEVSALDERLRAVLVPAKNRVWESGAGEPFWDFGYPRNAGEELAADLKAEGLAE
ncbi:MAG TPA: hypothetical protein VGG72_22765 [Bryobacteraceae bacterium]|jgi:hypothetical protein